MLQARDIMLSGSIQKKMKKTRIETITRCSGHCMHLFCSLVTATREGACDIMGIVCGGGMGGIEEGGQDRGSRYTRGRYWTSAIISIFLNTMETMALSDAVVWKWCPSGGIIEFKAV